MDITPGSTSIIASGLLEDVPIVTGATRTRVVVHNSVLRVALFVMDAGQELSEHSSPRRVLLTVIDGVVDFTMEEQTEQLEAGDVVYIAPNVRHSVYAKTPCRFELTMIDG